MTCFGPVRWSFLPTTTGCRPYQSSARYIQSDLMGSTADLLRKGCPWPLYPTMFREGHSSMSNYSWRCDIAIGHLDCHTNCSCASRRKAIGPPTRRSRSWPPTAPRVHSVDPQRLALHSCQETSTLMVLSSTSTCCLRWSNAKGHSRSQPRYQSPDHRTAKGCCLDLSMSRSFLLGSLEYLRCLVHLGCHGSAPARPAGCHLSMSNSLY